MAADLMSGRAKILLVEDEPQLLALLVRFLENVGHQVHALSNGTAALHWLGRPANRVQLAIAAAELPGLSGIDLATLIAYSVEGVKIVLLSDHGVPSEAILNGWPCLTKPFNPATLVSMVDSLLSSRPGRETGRTQAPARSA